MVISEEYYSGLLKTAESLAKNKELFLRDFAVIPVGIGVEHLLKQLFEELRSIDEINRGFLSYEYREFSKKKKYTHSRNKNTNLNLFGWIEFYQHRGIFGMLENTYGWKFDRFNGQTLHFIREKKNLYHSHYEDRDEMRSLSSELCEAFNEILVETHRISKSTALVVRNQLQNQSASELALIPGERELVRRQVDDILRLNPANENVLFLRAYLLRGKKTALDDIEKILRLNPNHFGAQQERILIQNSRTLEFRSTSHTKQTYNQMTNNISIPTPPVPLVVTTVVSIAVLFVFSQALAGNVLAWVILIIMLLFLMLFCWYLTRHIFGGWNIRKP